MQCYSIIAICGAAGLRLQNLITIKSTIIFALLRNIFRRLPINGHDIGKRAAEINFHLAKPPEKLVVKYAAQ
jgi:hypothetical protein